MPIAESTAMLASAGVSSGGGLIGSIINARQQNKARQWQEKMLGKQQAFESLEAEKAYERQMQMWRAENAYNTPLAQYHRALEAGINPNSLLNSINQAASVPSSPQASAPGSPSPIMTDIAGPFMNGINNSFQNMLTYQKARSAKSEADYADEYYRLTNEQMLDNIKVLRSQKLLNDEQAHQLRELTPLLVTLNKNQAKLVFQQFKVALEQAKLIKAQTSKTWQEKHNIKLRNVIDEVSANLAKNYEIVLGQGDAATIASLVLGDHAGVIVNKIIDSFKKAGTSLGENILPGVKKVFNGIKDDLSRGTDSTIFQASPFGLPFLFGRWLKNHTSKP